MIVEELLESAEESLKGKKVTDVRIGLSYTGALLEDESLGLSYSFRNEATQCCEVVDLAGDLEGNAYELARLALSSRAVDSSVGVATVNAVINQDVEGVEGPLLDFLDIEDGDMVGMVGNFKPVVNKVEKDIDFYVFERGFEGENVYPDWAAEQILPEADISIITGTAVINKTMDHLLELSSGAREIAILGPTTPMVPGVFESHGATFLDGMIVEDVEKALKIISQGEEQESSGPFRERFPSISPPKNP